MISTPMTVLARESDDDDDDDDDDDGDDGISRAMAGRVLSIVGVKAHSRREKSQRAQQKDRCRLSKSSNHKRIGFPHTTTSNRMNRPRFSPLQRPRNVGK